MKKPFSKLFWLSAVVIISACSSNVPTDETAVDTPKDTAGSEKKSHAQIVLYNIPSPVETSQLLLEAGAKYDASFTNNPSNSKQYKTAESQAVNLGVYGSDLSFAGIFENTQECMAFIKSVNGLCGELGIGGAFNESTAERIEKNKGSKDSVLKIISDSFWEADGYLKENNRAGISSLLIAGGWIEGMFIASKVYQKTKSEKIKTRIVSEPQANALRSLIAMLESEKLNAETQSSIVDGLKLLKSIYDKIPYGKSETKAVTDIAKHQTRIETTSAVKVSDELFAEIIKSVETLRSKIVVMK